MFKKIVKAGVVATAGYFIYKEVEKNFKNYVEVEEVPAADIIEMLKNKGFSILVGYDEKVLHFIKEDKSEAVQARLNEENEIFLIEYFYDLDGLGTLENVYPESVVLDNENGKQARLSFLRMLGSIGTSEARFINLVKEIIEDPELADLSI